MLSVPTHLNRNATVARAHGSSARGCKCESNGTAHGSFCASWGEPLPEVAWCFVGDGCPHAALREPSSGRKLDTCAREAGATTLVSERGCACTGKSNPRGFGAYCRRWETPKQKPWCYVAAVCPSPHPVGDYGRFDECHEGGKFPGSSGEDDEDEDDEGDDYEGSEAPSVEELDDDEAPWVAKEGSRAPHAAKPKKGGAPPTAWRQSEHGCKCLGKSNPHGFGAYCKKWEVAGQRPWCYVAAECPAPHPVGDFGRFDECHQGGEFGDDDGHAGQPNRPQHGKRPQGPTPKQPKMRPPPRQQLQRQQWPMQPPEWAAPFGGGGAAGMEAAMMAPPWAGGGGSSGPATSEHGCQCLGRSNPHGFGAYCHRWETPEQRPWCYVAAECPSPNAVGDYGKFDECHTDDAEGSGMGGGAMGGGGMGGGGTGGGGMGSGIGGIPGMGGAPWLGGAMPMQMPWVGGGATAASPATSEHGCQCLGRSNPHGFGAYCHRWETPEQRPWCYVAAECPSPNAVGDYGKFDECHTDDAEGSGMGGGAMGGGAMGGGAMGGGGMGGFGGGQESAPLVQALYGWLVSARSVRETARQLSSALAQQQALVRSLRQQQRDARLRAPAPLMPGAIAMPGVGAADGGGVSQQAAWAAQWAPWEQRQGQLQRSLQQQSWLLQHTKQLAEQLGRASEGAERARQEAALQARALDGLQAELHAKAARAADGAAQHTAEQAQAMSAAAAGPIGPLGGRERAALGWLQAGLAKEASVAAKEVERQAALAEEMRRAEHALVSGAAADAPAADRSKMPI